MAGGAANSTYRGLKFAGTPKNKFGWVMSTVETQSTPGFNGSELTGHTLPRYDVIEVYETRETDGVNWYLIGPDEWIEASFAALVYPTSEPPEGVVNGRWIEINLFDLSRSRGRQSRSLGNCSYLFSYLFCRISAHSEILQALAPGQTLAGGH